MFCYTRCCTSVGSELEVLWAQTKESCFWKLQISLLNTNKIQTRDCLKVRTPTRLLTEINSVWVGLKWDVFHKFFLLGCEGIAITIKNDLTTGYIVWNIKGGHSRSQKKKKQPLVRIRLLICKTFWILVEWKTKYRHTEPGQWVRLHGRYKSEEALMAWSPLGD